MAETYGRWVNDREVRFGLEYLAIATPESERAYMHGSGKLGISLGERRNQGSAARRRG
jgi:hypothetical protein